jgi:hypothetical protein
MGEARGGWSRLGASHHAQFKAKNDRIQCKPVGERSQACRFHRCGAVFAARLADGLPATARTAAVVGAGYQPNL